MFMWRPLAAGAALLGMRRHMVMRTYPVILALLAIGADETGIRPANTSELRMEIIPSSSVVPPSMATMNGRPDRQSSVLVQAEHLLRWLGKFHVAIIHFPIALL